MTHHNPGGLMTAATETMPALPEPPSHPDNHTMTWTKMELAAIEKYGRQCAEQAAAELARLQAECEALRKDAEWRPIETAPTDGTRVLLGRHMGDFGFVRGYGYFEGTAGSFLSGWISSGFDPVMSNLGLGHPTHWKPLPAPPTTLSTSTAPSGAEE